MYLEIRQPVSSWGRTPGQLFFMAVLYTLFFHSSRENLTKNYRNYYKAVTARCVSFYNSVILLTNTHFYPSKSCILSYFFLFLKFLLQRGNFPVRAASEAEQSRKKDIKGCFQRFFPERHTSRNPRAIEYPVITAPNFPSLQVRIPGHCEPVLRLPWQSPALGESGHNDGGDSHTRLPGHCEPVTDVTGVAIPRLEEPGSLIRVIANQRARWCGNPPVRRTTSRG